MALNRLRADQIKDLDLISESELHNLGLAYNVFLTQINATQVKVAATEADPAALTINGRFSVNTSDTPALTLSGVAGFYTIYAVADSNTDNFTLAFAAVGQNPAGATNYRAIGSIEWDGAQIVSKTSVSNSSTIEIQNPTTNGQQVFTLNDITYKVGTGSLKVFVNGIQQINGVNYTETDSVTVTFTGTELTTDDDVVFMVSGNEFTTEQQVDPSQLMDLTNDQSIGGNKTFTSNIILPSDGPSLDDHMVRKAFLGTAAAFDVGTLANQIAQLTASGILSNIDGVIKRVHYAYNDVSTTTTNVTPQSVGLELTLNPLSVNSTFICIGHIRSEATAVTTTTSANGHTRIRRESSSIVTVALASILIVSATSSSSNKIALPMIMFGVDQPNTIDQVKYEITHEAGSNDSITSMVGNQRAYLIVFEI